MTDRPPDEPARRRIRRIVVGLHPSPYGRAALQTAARLASLLGAELEGVYVQEERLMRLPGGSLLREVDSLSGRVRRLETGDMERQLRIEAARARRLLQRVGEELKLEWSFRTVRGEVPAVVGETGDMPDLVTLGTRARSETRGLGSTVRSLLSEPGRPVMVIRRGMRLGPHVHAVDDGGESGRRAVDVARSLTDREGTALTVHVATRTKTAERMEAHRAEFRETGRTDALVLAAPGRGPAAPLAGGACGLLVLPRSSLEDGPEALERILRHAACPILVV